MAYILCRCRNADSLKPISLSLQTLSSFTYPKLTPPRRRSSSAAATITTTAKTPPTPPPPQAMGAMAQTQEPFSFPYFEAPKLIVGDKPVTYLDEKPKLEKPTFLPARPRRAVESTAAYRFLLQFRRSSAPQPHPESAGHSGINPVEENKERIASSPDIVINAGPSPTLTAVNSEFGDDGDEKQSSKEYASSPPSLSTSTATETVSGSLELKCSMSAMRRGMENGVQSGIYHGKSA
ncbi:predicted protein [Coccidioides posadasii str. Silveira]|uniref:Predicted protein n=2 Tax=Coccidioides posadasii TaxID=199306 RepID=E9DD16_COCPS|nr:predicted protein [Coccidioides posadasii str. Silveira]KMM65771.1 hypothetical protein CPAG_02114 [Coccidioides posadasii RMSCC 3488]